ncbi:MAG: GrpB family protein [archaeon]|jgi:GrpB-like predicted nucleotidyltransferase (UPF0157 family)
MLKTLEKAISEKFLFKPYSKNYPKLFLKEKKLLSKALSSIEKKEVHHIGSTSVPGLGGKGVIDVIVIVEKKKVSLVKKLLKKAKFNYHHTMGKRSFYQKYYVDGKKIPRLIHLHLTFFGSGEKEKALMFRDYLISHPKEKKQYSLLKKKASSLHSSNGLKYAKFKYNFIVKILKKAQEKQAKLKK